MDSLGTQITGHLQKVDAERRRRRASPDLGTAVQRIKDFQHRRFKHTYADLLAQPRYARAARFFLDELYGPHDFTQRDAQFARIVPALVRLFPHEIVGTVADLAALHALSEELDSVMAERHGPAPLTGAGYAVAWRMVGRAADRERQIVLMQTIGGALERYTANPLLRHSLRMMRKPAQLAGLGALQQFLETGFDTFRELRGAAAFLQTISDRERALVAALFAANVDLPADFEAAASP